MKSRSAHLLRKSAGRSRLAGLSVFFLIISLLTQAFTIHHAPAGASAPTPPNEKALATYGRWETEFWGDDGRLSFQYVGDPYPTVPPELRVNKKADFTVGNPVLLTAIVTVHVNPHYGLLNADHVEDMGSPGSLTLVDDVGNIYGPFGVESPVSAVQQDGQVDPAVLWVALVDHVELPRGHYRVVDSEPTSQVCNGQAYGACAAFVKGVDAAAFAKYMDALAGVDEVPAANGKEPDKSTFSKPAALINNKPDPANTSLPSNPAKPAVFTTDKPVMVTKILDYHLNNGNGLTPGQVSFKDQNGTIYGPWQAYGQAFSGIPNAIWAITPNIEIPAGTYTVVDGDPASLSSDANGNALCVVNTAPAVSLLGDNVSGQYSVRLTLDDGTPVDLVLTVIDQKKTIQIAGSVAGYPFKFDINVSERGNGQVKTVTDLNLGAINDNKPLGLTMLLTFKKNGGTYALTGTVDVHDPSTSVSIAVSGLRTSTYVPGFMPTPPAGIGKVGHIPGPANATQAVTGLALPSLAAALLAAAASAGGAGIPGLGGLGAAAAGSVGSGYSGGGGGSEDSGDSGGEPEGAYTGGDSGGGDSSGEDAGSTYDGGESGGGDSSAGDVGSTYDGGDSGGSAGSVDTGGSGGTTPDSGNVPDANQTMVSMPPPAPVPAAPDVVGPLDGQTMNVHDYGDGLDKSYTYDAGSGNWVNPLTGGVYNADNYAASQQAYTETVNEATARAEADAAAAAAAALAAAKAAAPIPVTPVSPVTPKVADTTAGDASKTAAGTDAAKADSKVPEPSTAAMDGLKNSLEEINQNLKKDNYYVSNKFATDAKLVYWGEAAVNLAWDKTVGQLTGSKGLTCGGYVDKTREAVKAAVAKQFPGAKVEQAVFLEESTYLPKGFVDNVDAFYNDTNHTFFKVTLPDKTEYAIDFHGANEKMFGTNPPVLRPYREVREEWGGINGRIGNLDFHEDTTP